MKTLKIAFTVCLACLFFAADADAQRGRDRGDRGGRGGDRGGRPDFGGGRGGDMGRGGRPDSGGRGGDMGRGGRPDFGGRGGDSGGRPSFGGRPGGASGGSGSMMGRLDTNGDGRIDQGEIDAVPDRFKDFMKSRGIQMKPGSVEDVSNSMRTQFTRLREESGYGRPRDERQEQGATYGNRQKYEPVSSFRPRTKERLTTDLPEQYIDVDKNADGQVALHEWVLTRRTEMSLFEQIDTNRDGILEPVELVAFEDKKDEEEEVEKWIRDRLVIIGPGGKSNSSSGRSDSRGRGDDRGGDSKSDKEKLQGYASWAFKAMDRNKNGKIDEEEWSSSRRVRPLFENAGYKLTAMGEEEFTKRYMKAASKK